MGYAVDATVIRTRFNTEWPIEQPTIAFRFGGTDFADPPNDVPWVRLNILTSDDQSQVSMGVKRRFRRLGIVSVNIYVPAGQGDGLARELGDSVADIFMGRTVSGVIFRGTGLVRVGVDGAWDVWNSSTEYQADDLIQNPN